MNIDYLALLFRWAHILAAIVAVGGTVFSRFALLPAAMTTLNDDQRKALMEGVRVRWSKYVAGAIAFLLISGLYNIMRMEQSYKLGALYHALFGIKFILALLIFALASILSGRSALAQKLRQNARFWLSVNLIMAVLVVCISGVLRALPHPDKAGQPKADVGTVPGVPG